MATVEVATERFELRPWRESDLGVLAEAATDSCITSITTVPATYTTEAGHGFLHRMTELPADGITVPRAIADRVTDTVVGHISLRLRDLDLGRVGLGCWVLPSARGRGVAREAVTALSHWAFDRLGSRRIEPWNEPSKQVALSAGFVREGLLRNWQAVGGRWSDVEMFSRVRPLASGPDDR
ncbi:GNAT family N-acetyltransferase [Lentzea sp. CC55]|uniref:GNAT family N-acetyltransferase n=1 Tax=Lentzea sp. CC55 TaxID=2884909 RepID=UPI001F1E42E7|nr:GNAT family protein [Lentzea sp. CC55]MCG8923220.1 GNAT family N-acetyltransferase [Lentzea sp. CC55]